MSATDVVPGAVFGHLTVLSPVDDGNPSGHWRVKCACGCRAKVRASALRKGQYSCSRSCRAVWTEEHRLAHGKQIRELNAARRAS
jgi:hypothetical protein